MILDRRGRTPPNLSADGEVKRYAVTRVILWSVADYCWMKLGQRCDKNDERRTNPEYDGTASFVRQHALASTWCQG